MKSDRYVTYMWNPKYDMNELICKTETDSRRTQTEGYQRGKVGGEGINYKLGSTYTHYYI